MPEYSLIDMENNKFDKTTHNVITLNHAHYEVHSGDHYFMEGFVDLGNAEELWVALTTPDTTSWLHFLWEIGSVGAMSTTFYEGCTGTVGGTSVTPVNNNRNSSNTSGVTIARGASISTVGAIISMAKWGSRTSGGTQTRDDEIILKQNTIYARKFVSLAASNTIHFKANWYEHANR